jgi:RNA polymerase sigma-70 factor (ECF subfamily)
MDTRTRVTEQIPRLRRYARALTGDRNRADDLVQECLARALSKLHLWRPDSDLLAWLLTVMHNLFINDLRRERNAPPLLWLDEEHHGTPMRPTQEDGLEMRDLQSALLRLPPEQREVVLLIGLENMSYEDVAKTLDIPIGTVMSRLARGRERLRKLMSGNGEPLLRRVK